MHLKPIALACFAATLCAACGGGGNQNGQTAITSGQVSASYLLACIDSNQNWQCDDADTSRKVSASGDTGLTPTASQYVLLEGRDASNQRVSLLVSDKGSGTVTGLSTLRTMLGLGTGSALEKTLITQQGSQLAAALETGYAAAVAARPVALNALAAYSAAVKAQATASPSAVTPVTTIGSATSTANWAVPSAGDGTRQLSALASTVLGSNEGNRLYVFDPTASVVSTQQIDLIPAADTTTAQRRTASSRLLAALDRLVSVFVDTASAASSVIGTPTAPVVLDPGKGIAGAALTHGGAEAYVLMNMASGKYTDSSCATKGSEGLYKVGLSATDTSGYRMLWQSPACVHSGFTLLAADPSGARLVAWDATARQFWSLDGATMKERSVLALQAPYAPTAMTVSPGGRYAAVAGSDANGGGQLTLIDLDANRVVTTLAGAWTNPGQVAFADGVRKLLVTSGTKVYTVTLDNALQLIGTTTATLSEEIKGLAVAPDGSSYVVSGNTTASWRTLQQGTELAATTLPSGLTVKRIAVARDELVILGLQAAQATYKVYRLPLSLAQVPG